ncbi:MAG: hypothetical protein ACI8WY_000447, partial [Planctomycetota bacterium]
MTGAVLGHAEGQPGSPAQDGTGRDTLHASSAARR